LKLYLDTSALLKRYIQEADSETVMRRCAKADRVHLSALCVPELISGFQRLKREKKIGEDVYSVLKQEFALDAEQAMVVEPNKDVLREAVLCIERTGVRTLDAIHIATALKLGSDLFMTADRAQGEAAKTMGLRCEVLEE